MQNGRSGWPRKAHGRHLISAGLSFSPAEQPLERTRPSDCIQDRRPGSQEVARKFESVGQLHPFVGIHRHRLIGRAAALVATGWVLVTSVTTPITTSYQTPQMSAERARAAPIEWLRSIRASRRNAGPGRDQWHGGRPPPCPCGTGILCHREASQHLRPRPRRDRRKGHKPRAGHFDSSEQIRRTASS